LSYFYKRYIPEIELSLERNSENVPADGKYYILRSSKVIFSFRSQKEADRQFDELVRESGYKPSKTADKNLKTHNEGIERYLDAKALFYTIGPIRKKGGRGGRGGV